jgi:hypothetical protein
MLTANRSVLDILNAPYTFLTERLVKYYELAGKVEITGNGFQRVNWPDQQRAGVLGFASVLGMSSHYKQASPVLRGAWVLDTLLGTPIPPPPPDVPPLPETPRGGTPPPMRAMIEQHRASTACAACHNLMDPIGLGLENFDWMGRWRDRELNGDPVDARGSLPTGETFNGPVELREVLMKRKEDFVRQLTTKVLGYAIGRGQQDGDQCTIQSLMDDLAKNNYSVRTLIHGVVLSTPFRNIQTGVRISEADEPRKRESRRLLGTK